jgi:hypothetical protein
LILVVDQYIISIMDTDQESYKKKFFELVISMRDSCFREIDNVYKEADSLIDRYLEVKRNELKDSHNERK